MITKIVCALIGAVIMLVAIMVTACCKVGSDANKRMEEWINREDWL